MNIGLIEEDDEIQLGVEWRKNWKLEWAVDEREMNEAADLDDVQNREKQKCCLNITADVQKN